MTDKPILFSAAMVRALVAGEKTQTRRNLKPGVPVRYLPGDRLWVRETWSNDATGPVYRADGERGDVWWKPSLFMPLQRSRLTLHVTAVRIATLHAINDADARAEGVSDRAAYAKLWDDINGAGAWDANPLVVVVSFEVEKMNLAQARGAPS